MKQMIIPVICGLMLGLMISTLGYSVFIHSQWEESQPPAQQTFIYPDEADCPFCKCDGLLKDITPGIGGNFYSYKCSNDHNVTYQYDKETKTWEIAYAHRGY